jgi:methyl-accepting chemotaxis protein
MATMCLAMWLQGQDLVGTNRLIMIFIGVVAVAMVAMAIAMIVVSATAFKAVKGLNEKAEELKEKVLPLLDVAMDIGKTSQGMLKDAAPKVKTITDNLMDASDTLAETSRAARSAVRQFDSTFADVNMRAQRQVARVDGMVTATLTTTAEVAEAISNGIRVPVLKIAVMATQARVLAEGLVAKIKSMAAGTRFGSE